ncbi:transposase (plasmid) [Lyngbya confervoides BDU141951]|uniref:Transposase n=1 Tax=Lyngbya confervoides BDU141951 TaxID=1574623 RepID=A0ABD4T8Z1_9CYAN|nr:transposase [Lyngbya confervoides]MCM1985248.1 transposase [Lyngbya confervoides BDU141951]
MVNLRRKLKSLQRRLKRKQTGSANWKKAQIKVARLHERVAHTRQDCHCKQAHKNTKFVAAVSSPGAERKGSLLSDPRWSPTG